MGKKIVGVDIGTEWIRAVEVEGGGSARESIVRYREVRVPDGAVKNGEVAEVNTVAAILKQLWSQAGFTSKNVVLGMGNPKTLVRDLTVPRRSRREIRVALPFHVQDMLPVPVSEALLDFYPISESTSDTGPMVSGLLVAAVKDAVVANVRAVHAAGLNPVEVDLIPFALNRVLVRGTRSGGTVALIDIGARTTNVLITKDGVPQFVRIIAAGGSDVTKAIVGRLGLTPEQADAGKRRLGLGSGWMPSENAEVAEVIRELTHELLNSLRNTLGFYTNSRHGQLVDRIQLSGGGSFLPDLAPALQELTRIDVSHEDPFTVVPLKRAAGKSTATLNVTMSVALGLALGRAA